MKMGILSPRPSQSNVGIGFGRCTSRIPDGPPYLFFTITRLIRSGIHFFRGWGSEGQSVTNMDFVAVGSDVHIN